MSEDEENPGYNTLEKHEKQVLLTIKNNLDDVAKFLKDEKIIPLTRYEEITDPETTLSKDYRARLLFRRLMSMIAEDDKIYVLFVEYIRKKLTKSCHTVHTLDQTYADLTGETITESQGTVSLV